MESIELNHWFVDEDSLSISLMRFYVEIKICHNECDIFYILNVYEHGVKALSLDFTSLEDSVSFTEQIIKNCIIVSEIMLGYQRKVELGEYKNNKVKEKIKKKNRKMLGGN